MKGNDCMKNKGLRTALFIWITVGIGFPIFLIPLWSHQYNEIIQKINSPEIQPFIWNFILLFIILETVGFLFTLLSGKFIETLRQNQSIEKKILGNLLFLVLVIIDGFPALSMIYGVAILGFNNAEVYGFLLLTIILYIIYGLYGFLYPRIFKHREKL